MKRKTLVLALIVGCLLCLWGCDNTQTQVQEPEATEAVVLATVPEDGNPDDVTCKGSYTGEGKEDAVVAAVGDAKLTNEQLRVWYNAEIARYRPEKHECAPDFTKDLDTQVCEIDDSVRSWQQYFLREALNTWHTAQTLETASRTDKLVLDEYFQPDPEQETYMADMPATEVLYGYQEYYQPNSMHRAFLEEIPRMLQQLAEDHGYADAQALAEAAFGSDAEALEEAVRLYNYGYMYFTQLSYSEKAQEPEETQSASADGERYVDIRHILLVPQSVTDWKGNVTDAVTVAKDGTVTCGENLWEKNENRAKKLLREWKNTYKQSEKGFRELAYRESADTASSENGGIYRRLRQGQLIAELDQWCFDPARQAGDVTTIRTKFGHHILYFAGRESMEQIRKEQEETIRQQQDLIAQLKKRFPVKVDYSEIRLPQAEAAVSWDALLYPDVAHERYPELPLYLQQAYGDLKYGDDRLYTHGCGITSFSLLSSYMLDEEYTPAEMCAQFRRYNADGTDGMIFINEPSTMGYYLKARTYDAKYVEQALREGHKVIALVGPGYWTTTGHYITLEKITEDEKIQVRDTHMFNYAKLPDHGKDKHELKSVFGFGVGGYWVMSKKVTHIPNCQRCGDGTLSIVQTEDYLCEKCETAMIRRNVWLNQ